MAFKTSDEKRAYARAYHKRRAAKDPEYERARRMPPTKQAEYDRRTSLKRKYGITLEDYATMLASQGGVCALCGASNPGGNVNTRLGQKFFQVDHDHVTGRVRALLCLSCNTGLGKFRDDPAALRRAAVYLEHHADLHRESIRSAAS